MNGVVGSDMFSRNHIIIACYFTLDTSKGMSPSNRPLLDSLALALSCRRASSA